MNIKNMPHSDQIDGLRGLCVLSVIAYHFDISLFQNGHLGVDLFFIISGYLITLSILQYGKLDFYKVGEFYRKRAARILPPLFVVIALVLLVFYFLVIPPFYQRISKSALATLALIPNLYFGYTTNYFDPQNDLKPLIHTWSIGVEEQFYIIFPLLIIVIYRVKASKLPFIVGVLGAFSLFLAYKLMLENSNFAFYSMPTRFWELALGVIAAFHSRHLKFKRSISIVIDVAVCILIVIFNLNIDGVYPSIYTILTLFIGYSLLVAISRGCGSKWLLNSKWLRAFGISCYSLYLVHQPVISAINYLMVDESHIFRVAIQILFIVSFGLILYRYVEVKYRGYYKRGWLSLLLVLAPPLILIGILITATKFQNSTNPDNIIQKSLYSNIENSGAYLEQKFNSLIDKKFESNGKIKLLIIGDSFAQDVSNVLFESNRSKDYDISTIYVKRECGVLLIDLNILRDYWPKNLERYCEYNYLGSKPDHLNMLSDADEIWIASNWYAWEKNHFHDSLLNIHKYNNSKITVFGTKDFGRIDYYAISHATGFGYKEIYGKPSSSVHDINSYISIKTNLIGDNFVDLQKYICNFGTCRIFTDAGDIMTVDGKHLTQPGASEISRLFFENK